MGQADGAPDPQTPTFQSMLMDLLRVRHQVKKLESSLRSEIRMMEREEQESPLSMGEGEWIVIAAIQAVAAAPSHFRRFRLRTCIL